MGNRRRRGRTTRAPSAGNPQPPGPPRSVRHRRSGPVQGGCIPSHDDLYGCLKSALPTDAFPDGVLRFVVGYCRPFLVLTVKAAGPARIVVRLWGTTPEERVFFSLPISRQESA